MFTMEQVKTITTHFPSKEDVIFKKLYFIYSFRFNLFNLLFKMEENLINYQ